MNDLEERLAEHLTRTAARAVPRRDLEAVTAANPVPLQRLEPRFVMPRWRVRIVVAVVVVAVTTGAIALARRTESSLPAGPATGDVSMYFAASWLPADLVLINESIASGCDPAATSPSSCSGLFSSNLYGNPHARQRAVTVAVLGPATPLITNAPVAVAVRGKPAKLDQFEPTQGPVQQWILSWAEDDTTLLAMDSIGLTEEEVLRIADGLQRVSKEKWDATSASVQPDPSFPPADPSTAIERASLTTPTGQVVRLSEGLDRSFTCVVSTNGSTSCAGRSGPMIPIDERPATPTIFSGGETNHDATFVVAMPYGFPRQFTVRSQSGTPVSFAATADQRFVLIAEAISTPGASDTQFDFVAPDGTVIASATKPNGLPSTTGSNPSTTR